MLDAFSSLVSLVNQGFERSLLADKLYLDAGFSYLSGDPLRNVP